MNNVISHRFKLVKLNGKILNYKVSRKQASFVYTENDRTKLEVIAIAASLAGMGGQAISVASNANSTEEDADYVEFSLDGKIIKGWLWYSPFHEGDEVKVAAEWQSDHYEVFGVARPSDQTISLYPHCSRAKTRHIKNAFKWWLITAVMLQVVISIVFLTIGLDAFIDGWKYMTTGGAWWLPLGLTVFCAIAIISMARQWMPFAKVAEKVFSVLELPNPHNIDLVKSSKNKNLPQDSPEFGSMYFRY
ncbi:putative type VI secretion system effector [Duganella aceris]|uniref:DUF2812 domain-containing protein n=1 Tax=Duganella aceris TaxID=2703883 RepID=A0ABX0FF77_9BURK|nr:putative type VI secretion system effector [Duganella aceris]NGZ83175.1 hypothetical protein [Duganella aceris]